MVSELESIHAHGYHASSQATQAVVRKAVRTSMMPLINQMSVVGLVSIPGMMTGQILAGSDPSEASR